MRTPYGVGPYGADAYPASLGPWKAFQDDGYIFVNQDVRGRYVSEGYYQFMTPHIAVKRGPTDVDESSDPYDTIDWLVKNVAGNTMDESARGGTRRRASSWRPGCPTRIPRTGRHTRPPR